MFGNVEDLCKFGYVLVEYVWVEYFGVCVIYVLCIVFVDVFGWYDLVWDFCIVKYLVCVDCILWIDYLFIGGDD